MVKSGRYARDGEQRERRTQLSVIVVTDGNLHAEVQAGRFRHDLYHKLARLDLVLPPLRERTEDVPAAARWMANRVRQSRGLPTNVVLDGEEARMPEWRGNDNTYGSRHYVQFAQKDGSLKSLRALVLLDMIGDRDLVIKRDSNSTPWLVDIIWSAASRLGHASTFSNQLTVIEDDHVPFLRAGVPAVDIIDLEDPTWHTPQDDLEHVNVKSLQTVGDVVVAAIPEIEKRITTQR